MIRRPGGLAEEQLTRSIIGGFYESYNALGEGFLEPVYAAALQIELESAGHDVAREIGAQV